MQPFFMKKYLPAILWAAFIMVICGIPGDAVPAIYVFSFDKLGHSIIFFILYVLILAPLQKDGRHNFRQHLTATILTIAFAGLTEILQDHVFINRNGEVMDFLADSLGAVLGYFFISLVENTRLYKKFLSFFSR
jgi:VanZ family protein